MTEYDDYSSNGKLDDSFANTAEYLLDGLDEMNYCLLI